MHNTLTTVMTRIIVDKSTDQLLNHIRFVFYHNVKESEINVCLDN